jgi:hypothetical protein
LLRAGEQAAGGYIKRCGKVNDDSRRRWERSGYSNGMNAAIGFALSILAVASAAAAASPYDVIPFGLSAEEQRQVASGVVIARIVPLDGMAQSGVAIGTIAAPIGEVIKGIEDVSQHTKYFPRLVEARVVSGSGNLRVVHQKIDVPFPLQDRYYDITVTSSRVSTPRDVFSTSWTYVKGSGNIADTTGGWTLTPIDANTTLAYYHVHADIGTWLPQWLLNMANRSTLPDVITAMRRYCRDHPGGR